MILTGLLLDVGVQLRAGVRLLSVIDLDAGAFVGVVEPLAPCLDPRVGAGELRRDAQPRHRDRRPVEAAPRSARLGESGVSPACAGTAAAALAAVVIAA